MSTKTAVDGAMDKALDMLIAHGSVVVILVRHSSTDDGYSTRTRASGDPALIPQMLDDAVDMLIPGAEEE